MDRRFFIGGFLASGLCPICAQTARASERSTWSYQEVSGPAQWGALEKANAACSAGAQQSPIDITGVVEASLPPLEIDWRPGGTLLNNGHTIQVNMPKGSTLARGDRRYELLQYHFHAPSEHLVNGRSFAMEVHFVHRDTESGALGVLGVFIEPGERDESFESLAAVFPGKVQGSASVADVDPGGLLPDDLAYWFYEGSLTTPPCSEIVDWMVLRTPKRVAAEDIRRFTALYSGNARPVLQSNRRFILASQ
ncbi:carbonic anhydrase [Nitratireductor sp. OM-1]|uniref:carbonic anhydrase n=1 Tax=Nitratireductor sp. OM-1 TaxID=1756988 RepID=UPI000DE011FD|nr:carbonic anhydrase [Nitratireductor sp. OM-1]